jgi:DNA-directed RNA polymerase subunit RPC12/RpoP
MDSNRRLKVERPLYRTVLVVWVINAVIMLFLLNSIDVIVNTQLYDFGLQLSADWLLPYWTYIRLSYALLGLSIILSLLALAVGYFRKNALTAVNPIAKNLAKDPTKPHIIAGRQLQRKEENQTSVKSEYNTENFCSSCGKNFSRPLVLLDFEDKKNQLVNVCPYCNHKLDNKSKQPQKARF